MRILVVDDQPELRAFCQRALAGAGYDVETAASGEAALAAFAQPWDLVLTDLHMTGEVHGMEVIREARRRTGADVILMTGYPDLQSVIQALREGAYDYLIKPFEGEALLHSVRRCLEKRHLSSELKREQHLRGELARAYRDLEDMQRVKEMFGQFIAPEVARYVLGTPEDRWRRGVRVMISVLFADVRDFTSYAARVDPEEVADSLNALLTSATEEIHRHGGLLNKFMGDGLLAVFGAPVPSDLHADAAARAGLDIQERLRALNAERRTAGRAPLHMGIGINTGEAVAGGVGTHDRVEYSVIGSSVNMGARLEKAAGPGQILVGSETAARLGPRFRLRETPALFVQGSAAPIRAFELTGFDAP